MADAGWRTNRYIQQARAAVKELGGTAAILLILDEKDGTMQLATYGTTGPRCLRAEELGEVAYEAVVEAYSRVRWGERSQRS